MNKKITVLIDNDSWILPYGEQLVDKLGMQNFNAKLVREMDSVEEGWINFMIGCTKITPPEVLGRNQYNLVVHESNLPKGKGFAPMAWQILENKNKIPVCLVEATNEVDSGDIWIRDFIELEGTELNNEWRKKQGQKTIELCLKFVSEFDALTRETQTGVETFYARRTPADSELDVNKTLSEQFNLLRVVDNQSYPAFFFMDNKKYIIKIEKP